jgi:hypothetical protein
VGRRPSPRPAAIKLKVVTRVSFLPRVNRRAGTSRRVSAG